MASAVAGLRLSSLQNIVVRKGKSSMMAATSYLSAPLAAHLLWPPASLSAMRGRIGAHVTLDDVLLAVNGGGAAICLPAPIHE